jgi:hypothetical protein
MSKDQFNIKNRAFKIFQSGQGADCVIEVVQQIDDQDTEIRVFFLCFYWGTLLGFMPLDSVKNVLKLEY